LHGKKLAGQFNIIYSKAADVPVLCFVLLAFWLSVLCCWLFGCQFCVAGCLVVSFVLLAFWVPDSNFWVVSPALQCSNALQTGTTAFCLIAAGGCRQAGCFHAGKACFPFKRFGIVRPQPHKKFPI